MEDLLKQLNNLKIDKEKKKTSTIAFRTTKDNKLMLEDFCKKYKCKQSEILSIFFNNFMEELKKNS